MRKHSAEGRVRAGPEWSAKAQEAPSIPQPLHPSAAGDEYSFGPFVLRSDRRELICDGVVRPLERRAFDLLHYLLKNHGRVVTKEELLEQVWHRRCVTDSVIAQGVLKVRKALSDAPGFECPVHTVHRVGYRVVGEVRHRRVAPGEIGRAPASLAVLWTAPQIDGPGELAGWLPNALAGFGVLSLQAHGVQPVDPDHLPPTLTGHVTARGRLRHSEGVFTMEIELIASDWTTRASANAGSPFEAVWQAAGSAALAMRLRQILLSITPSEIERRWERLAALTRQPAPAMGVTTQLLPSLWCRSLVERGLDAEADILMEAAWRGDPRTPQEAVELRRRAGRVAASRYEGWADLCLAVHEWTAGDSRRVAHLVDRALTHFDQSASTALAVRAGATSEHLMAAVGGDWLAPAWWRALRDSPTVDGSSGIRRWHRLAWMHRQMARESPGALGLRTIEVGSNVAPGCEGLQSLLHTLSGAARHADGDIDAALTDWIRAHELAERSAWLTPRLLCRLALGDMAARLGERGQLDHCLNGLDALAQAGSVRWRAVTDWLLARRMRMDGRAAAAWTLLEQALPVLSHCKLWFRDECWLFAIDTAWHTRSRAALVGLQEGFRAAGEPGNRSLAAVGLATEATIALIDGDAAQGQGLIVRAWQTAPISPLKRQLAMAAATAMLWRRPANAQMLDQALAQAGAWLQRSLPGQRLCQLHRRPMSPVAAAVAALTGAGAPAAAASSGEEHEQEQEPGREQERDRDRELSVAQRVAESDTTPGWLWAP